MITRLRRVISNQLGHPSGRLGRLTAAAMNRGNAGLNASAMELLDVGPGRRVLDLGFGGGLTFGPLLAAGATVVGVDRAGDMVAAATEHEREAVDAGRLRVLTGDASAIPLEDGEVDRVLSVNTVYFWPDLDAALREVHRVLTAAGRVVIGVREASVMQRLSEDVVTVRDPADLRSSLERAGFAEAEVRTLSNGAAHLITGVRGA